MCFSAIMWAGGPHYSISNILLTCRATGPTSSEFHCKQVFLASIGPYGPTCAKINMFVQITTCRPTGPTCLAFLHTYRPAACSY